MVRSLQISTNTFNLPTIPIFSLSLIVKLRLSRAGASVAKYLNVTFRNSSLPFCGQSAGGFEPSLDSKGGSDNDKELPSFELKKGDFDIILDRKTSSQINPYLGSSFFPIVSMRSTETSHVSSKAQHWMPH